MSVGFGAMVRRLRTERGMTLAEVASLVGVGPSWLADVERDRRGVPLSRSVLLARALEQNEDEFVRLILQREVDDQLGEGVFAVMVGRL